MGRPLVPLAEPGQKAEVQLTCARAIYGPPSGRNGSLIFDDPERPGVGIAAPDFEGMLGGRLLGAGAIVRISIEVIEGGQRIESSWKPSVGETWDEYESYCLRKPVRIYSHGGYVRADRVRSIRPQHHAGEGSPLGIFYSDGYGGGWYALTDVVGLEIMAGDEETIELLAQHGVAYREFEQLPECGSRFEGAS